MKKIISAVKVDALTKRQTSFSIFIMAVLFFVFGFVTWLNAILIPYFKIACELTNFQSYLVAFSFYISYFVMSVPSSYLLRSIGFKKGMVIAFWIMAAGAFIFVPAAILRTYEIFLIVLFSLGSGLAILQTAANSYVTILGPRERAAQRMGIMGICNKTAGILAPLVLATAIFKSTDTELFKQIPSLVGEAKNVVLSELLHRVIFPYICMSSVLIGLGLLIRYSSLPEIDTEHETPAVALANVGKTSIFHFPHLILGALAIFLHVGTHVIAIDTIIGYAVSMNMSLLEAKVFPSYTLFMTLCGYLVGIITIPRYISQENVLRLCTVLGFVFSLLILFTHKETTFLGHKADISIWFIVMLGFSNSMIYAGIWPLALNGLGKFTKLGSSLLIMGLSGQAVLPLLYVHYADTYSLRYGYWILAPCFLYLIFYAFYGYRIRYWSFLNRKNEIKNI